MKSSILGPSAASSCGKRNISPLAAVSRSWWILAMIWAFSVFIISAISPRTLVTSMLSPPSVGQPNICSRSARGSWAKNWAKPGITSHLVKTRKTGTWVRSDASTSPSRSRMVRARCSRRAASVSMMSRHAHAHDDPVGRLGGRARKRRFSSKCQRLFDSVSRGRPCMRREYRQRRPDWRTGFRSGW